MLIRASRFFNAPGNGMKAPHRLFWAAFAVRVLYVTLAHTYRIHGFEQHFNFGWEAGRIAKALVSGYGYADPFANSVIHHTGPTAWLPPLYPLLVAGVFRLSGVYTPLSAWILLALNCIFSALTAMAVWEIGARCCGPGVALWSGWLWALYPAAMQYATRWIWETTLTTALFAWIIVLALRMRSVTPGPAPLAAETPQPAPYNPGQTRRWALFGLAWGLVALSNSTLLLFMPVCALWILKGTWPNRATRTRALRDASLAAIIFLACIAPWTWRNWHVFHVFIPMRGNLGAELYMGDGPGSTGFLMTYDHPHVAPDQLKLYAAMGEVRYTAMRGAQAKAYIKAHPAHFAAIVATRIYFYWAGVPSDEPPRVEIPRILNYAFLSLSGLMGLALALRRHVPAAGLLAWAFALLPLTYYLITVHARFRHPLEPLICVLGVYLFQSAERRSPSSRQPVSSIPS